MADVENLIVRMNNLRVDDWPTLHTWARNFCRTNNLTHTQLLQMCNLEDRTSYLRYLARSGSSLAVSNKLGSVGRALRDGLNHLKTRVEANDIPPAPDQPDVERIIYERYLDMCVVLQRHLVTSYRISSVAPLTLELYVLPGCRLTKEDAVYSFRLPEHLAWAAPADITFKTVYNAASGDTQRCGESFSALNIHVDDALILGITYMFVD